MEKIRPEEILDLVAYEKIRPSFRKEVVEMKKNRRLPVGDMMTLVFENRQTVLFQIQEMVRVERLVEEKAIRHEVETYNLLVPRPHQLSATMLIEIQELEKIKNVLDRLVGLTKGCVHIDLPGHRVDALFDMDQSEEDRISAVQYITFSFSPEQERLFTDPAASALLVVDHPNYSHRREIAGALRLSLIEDLRT